MTGKHGRVATLVEPTTFNHSSHLWSTLEDRERQISVIRIEECEARIDEELARHAAEVPVSRTRPARTTPRDARGRPDGHSHGRRGDRPDARRRSRRGPVALPDIRQLLFVAGLGAGHVHQRRQAPREGTGQALRMAASTTRNSKTAIGAAHRRRLARMDSAKAAKATAHQLARLIHAMLTRGEQYVERDLAAMETERRDRKIKHL